MAHTWTTTTTANDVALNAAHSAIILNEARAAIVAADKILRYDLPVPGPNAITVGRFQAVTAAALTQGAEQEAQAISTDGATITCSRVGLLVDITEEVEENSVPTFSPRALERCAAAMADKLDTDVLALASGLSTNVVNATGVAATFAHFQNLIYLLDAQNAPTRIVQESALGSTPSGLQGYIFVGAPVQVAHLQSDIGKSAAAWVTDPRAADVLYADGSKPAGFKGSLLGVPVFSSSNVPTATDDRVGMMFSPAFAGLAVRYLARVKTQENIKARSNMAALTSSYGLAELVDAYAAKLVSKSAY